MFLLRCDIRSHCSGDLYGSAGSIVKVINERGEVAIVENEEGKRFSCRLENIVTDGSLIQASTQVNKISKQGPIKRGKSSKPGPTQTLF